MRHVTIMSLSSSLGIMAIYLVDLCDIFFISLLGEKQMAAAAGFASTVMFFVSAANIGISIATGTLVSAALGAGKNEKAREIAGTATTSLKRLLTKVAKKKLGDVVSFKAITEETTPSKKYSFAIKKETVTEEDVVEKKDDDPAKTI